MIFATLFEFQHKRRRLFCDVRCGDDGKDSSGLSGREDRGTGGAVKRTVSRSDATRTARQKTGASGAGGDRGNRPGPWEYSEDSEAEQAIFCHKCGNLKPAAQEIQDDDGSPICWTCIERSPRR